MQGFPWRVGASTPLEGTELPIISPRRLPTVAQKIPANRYVGLPPSAETTGSFQSSIGVPRRSMLLQM